MTRGRSRGALPAIGRAALIALILAACSGRRNVAVGAQLGPALAAALRAADDAREPWRCGASDGPGAPEETLTVAGRTWRASGHTLALVEAGDAGAAHRELVIAVVADAAGSAPATLAALGRLRARIARADLMLTLGGMGGTAAELDAVLAVLADHAPWPVVALPGDLEPVTALDEAIAAARQRGAAVLDGRLVQRIDLPGAVVALLPGTGAASRLVPGADGCRYAASDAAAALTALTAQPGLRIAASSEPPRTGEPATGELALTPAAGQELDIALHGSTGPATAACSGHRDGAATAVTPGSSDATPRLPGPRRSPTAGVLTVRDTGWIWQPITDEP